MQTSYIALDLETTGLNPKYDKILEIGAVRMEHGTVLDKYSVIVNPGVEVTEFITGLTGISQSMADQGMETKAAMEGLAEFCHMDKNGQIECPILGHNISFDYSFLRQTALYLKIPFDCQVIDTLQIARKFLPELPGRSLEALCRHYDILQEKKHRAYEDAQSAGYLYEKLVDQFGETEDSVFDAKTIVYRAKKDSPITNSQKVYLNDLVKYHRIELDIVVDELTKRQASRMIDKIISEHGRIIKR